MVLRPESRGELRLASADPRTPPCASGRTSSPTEKDWQTLREGLRLVRDIGRQKALAPFVGERARAGPGRTRRETIDAHIRATGITVHHPLGTCRWASTADPMAVVDPAAARARRRAGCAWSMPSVMPDLIGGNINAPVIMIAEKAADLIRGA